MTMLKNDRSAGRRARNKAEKLARIEDAARALFAEQGYEATTTRALAERADIAAGTLFTYFPEKRLVLVHLLRTDIDRAIERAFRSMPAVPPADPVDALVHLFGSIFRTYERDPSLARVFVKELLFIEDELAGEMGAWTLSFIARLGQLIGQWRDAGALGPRVEPATAAYQVFSLYYLGLVTWLATAAITPTVRDTMFRTSLEQLVRGLAPAPSETARARRTP